MTTVNGFNIDTPEGAKDYLKSEGVDVEAYIEKGLDELKRHKALVLANVGNSCPFCGADPTITQVGETWSVMCDNSNCKVCPESEGITKDEALRGWNQRA
ncbi:MAG: Lar family restriction alleviation protein [Chitinophagaceae bacterium]|nr:Lar family restriction alleviation protein [Chitinophagaceae bacterium]